MVAHLIAGWVPGSFIYYINFTHSAEASLFHCLVHVNLLQEVNYFKAQTASTYTK
jgi:hypothetical protein